MTTYLFSSFEEARSFAQMFSIEQNATVRLIRQADDYIVETIEPPVPSSTRRQPILESDSAIQPKLKRSPALMYAGLGRFLDPGKPLQKRFVKDPKPLSVHAAKRGSGKKKLFDERSLYITNQIEPREVSGGLPSLGKRK